MSRSHMLLIVDEDPFQRVFVRETLSPLGWTVREAADGQAALGEVAAIRFALILLDVRMPLLDGLETAKLIRQQEDGGARTPILAFTAWRDPLREDRIRAAGMDGVIAKPCSPEALIAAVRPWRSNDDTLDRLGGLFGEDRLDALLAGFRDQLKNALAGLETGDRGLAHRIGGLAGTLGFADVSSAWLALSEGDDSSAPAARLTAVAALATMERRLSE